jgi:hypothetical protein
MKNTMPAYNNCIANDPGVFRTVGSSFEFGGIDDAQTRETWMYKILEFFGGIITGTQEFQDNRSLDVNCYPNPFKDQVSFEFDLEKTSWIQIAIMNQQGQIVKELANSKTNAGEKSYYWSGTNMSGNKVSNGIYFYTIKINSSIYNGKIVYMQ